MARLLHPIPLHRSRGGSITSERLSSNHLSEEVLNRESQIIPLLLNPKDNPCSCCCSLIKAAKTLVIINVITLTCALILYAFTGFISPDKNKNNTDSDADSLTWSQLNFGYECVFPVPRYLHIFAVIDMMICLVISAYFLAVLYNTLTWKQRILYSNLYMWINFCNPAIFISFLHLLITLADRRCRRSLYVWIYFSVVFALEATLLIFNGLVARGYRNALLRKRNPSESVRRIPAITIVDGTGGDPSVVQPDGVGATVKQDAAVLNIN